MSTITYCDKCGAKNTLSTPVYHYQITAKLESVPEVDDLNYAIEFEMLDLCQPCAQILADACKAFIKSATTSQEPTHE